MKKKVIVFILIVSLLGNVKLIYNHFVYKLNYSHQEKIEFPYWTARQSLFEILTVTPNKTIFLGNSITDYCEWSELFNDSSIINRGIKGDGTEGVLSRLSTITKVAPKKIFLMIGVNDVYAGESTDTIFNRYQKIINTIRKETPKSKLYLLSVLPTSTKSSNDSILILNTKINKLVQAMNNDKIRFISLYNDFVDKNGLLRNELSNDGTHLLGNGYMILKNKIEKYISE